MPGLCLGLGLLVGVGLGLAVELSDFQHTILLWGSTVGYPSDSLASCLLTFLLSNESPKITRILTLYQANVATLTLFSKGDKILTKNLYECKGYNARQFITKFLNKGWTKNSINRLLVKFGTVDRRLDSGRRSVHTDENVDTVKSLWLSQEDSESSNSQRNFTWGGGSMNRQFRGLFTKICVLSATRKGTLNSWLKHTALQQVIFVMQFERR